MKNIIIGLGILVLTLFTTFSLIALNINTTQENRVEESTRIAAYQTLKECKTSETWAIIQDKYKILSSENSYSKEDVILINRFQENLKELIKSSEKHRISYKIIEADWKEGILSVEVKSIYQNLGIKNVVKSRKTVIYTE